MLCQRNYITKNSTTKAATTVTKRKKEKAMFCTGDAAPPTTEAPPLPMEAEPREDCDSAAIARWISSSSWALSEATWA